MLIPDRVNHLSLSLDLFNLHRVTLRKRLRSLNLVRHVQGVILSEPAYGSGLNPCCRLRLHFLSCFMLQLLEALERLQASNSFKLLSLRDDDHAGLLVDVHQRLNASAVK